MSYTRHFITFGCEAEGYGTGGKRPSGSCVLEARGNEGKLSCFAQNIKPDTAYSVYLLFPDGGRYAGMPVGKLAVEAGGKSQSRFSFPADKILSGRFRLDDCVAVAVIAARASEVTSPLCGYKSAPVSWRRGFYDAAVKIARDAEPKRVEVSAPPQQPIELPPDMEQELIIEVPPEDECLPEPEYTPDPKYPFEPEREPETMPVFEQIPDYAPEPREPNREYAPAPREQRHEYAPEPLAPTPASAQRYEYAPEPLPSVPAEAPTPQMPQPLAQPPAARIPAPQPSMSVPAVPAPQPSMSVPATQSSIPVPAVPVPQPSISVPPMEIIDMLDELFDKYPPEAPFQKQNRSAKWIKVSVDDAVPPPLHNPYLFSEDFIVEAHEKFGHLLVGAAGGGARKQFILGVPCHYDLGSRADANALGFTQFKPCEDVRITRGLFGYWLMFINL